MFVLNKIASTERPKEKHFASPQRAVALNHFSFLECDDDDSEKNIWKIFDLRFWPIDRQFHFTVSLKFAGLHVG